MRQSVGTPSVVEQGRQQSQDLPTWITLSDLHMSQLVQCTETPLSSSTQPLWPATENLNISSWKYRGTHCFWFWSCWVRPTEASVYFRTLEHAWLVGTVTVFSAAPHELDSELTGQPQGDLFMCLALAPKTSPGSFPRGSVCLSIYQECLDWETAWSRRLSRASSLHKSRKKGLLRPIGIVLWSSLEWPQCAARVNLKTLWLVKSVREKRRLESSSEHCGL